MLVHPGEPDHEMREVLLQELVALELDQQRQEPAGAARSGNEPKFDELCRNLTILCGIQAEK